MNILFAPSKTNFLELFLLGTAVFFVTGSAVLYTGVSLIYILLRGSQN